MPFKESGIWKGSDCAGMCSGRGGRVEGAGMILRGADLRGSTVFLYAVNTSLSLRGSSSGMSRLGCFCQSCVLSSNLVEMNVLVDKVFLVLPKLELGIKLFAQLPDILLFSLLFDTLLIGHPDPCNVDLVVLLVALEYALDRIVNGTDAHLKVASNPLQVLFQVPDTFGQEFCPELTTSPEATDWGSGFRVWRLFGGIGYEARNLDLVGWECEDGKEVSEGML